MTDDKLANETPEATGAWTWFGNDRSSDAIRWSFDLPPFFSNHHRPNAAMLVPHRPRLVSDGPNLLHEREGLSMPKSLR